jgi:hypothetical protein
LWESRGMLSAQRLSQRLPIAQLTQVRPAIDVLLGQICDKSTCLP